MHRCTRFAAIAATGLLALPAAASADSIVVAGPIKAKGYDLTLTATNGASSLTVMATRSSGKSTQTHMWTAQGATVKVGAKAATIKGNLGPFGSIKAKVKTSRSAKGRVPKGCTGKAGTVRSGKLTGKTKLVLDTTFFRTVAPKSMKAQIVKSGKLDCRGGNGPSQNAKGLMFTASDQTGAGQRMLSIVREGSKVSQSMMVMGENVVHMISAETGARGLEAAADLSSATAQAAGGFLTGTLRFAGESMDTMATGELSGNFAAKFDSIGTQSLPAGTTGMLMNR